MFFFLLVLGALLTLVTAHFKLEYPAARGFDEDTLGTFPCGGQDTPSPNRTSWPLSGGPIQLFMGHTAARVEVLIALGNDVGGAFNTVLLPTLQETGPNDFCLGAVVVPATIGGVSVTAGMNATLQVITNGDSGDNSGLYNCADITFTSTPLTSDEYTANCVNSTGISVGAISNAATINANGTTVGASTNSSTTTTSPASGTATAAATLSSVAASAPAASVGAGLLGAAAWLLVGAAGLL